MDQKRNELLVYRYLYHGIKNPYAHALVLKNLSDEFFLCERRINDIISQMHGLLAQVRKEMPATAELKKKWPHLVW